MKREIVVLSTLLACGCGGRKPVDACAGITGSCVSLQVNGSSSITRIDRAHLHASATGFDSDQDTATSLGTAVSLPVAIALQFQSAFDGQVDVTGYLSGSAVGFGSTAIHVGAGQHATATVTLAAMFPDDMSASDSSNPNTDMPQNVDGGTPVAARLISPLSTSSVTAKRPALHWMLNGPGTPVVDLCSDRACSNKLAVNAVVDSSGTKALPDSDLPKGVVFWRVRTQLNGQEATSATWELWSGASGAPHDTSFGTTLDVNGDGYADLVVSEYSGPKQAWLYKGSSTGLKTGSGMSLGAGQPYATSAGDVNGDGFADVVAFGKTGEVDVYYGSASGIQLTAATMLTNATDRGFGNSAASAGDVNGDGYSDLIVGAPAAATANGPCSGRAWIYFGSASGIDPNNPQSIDDPYPSLNGVCQGFATSVASADVDGDGYSDVVIGTPGASPSGQGDGEVTIYRGSAQGLQPMSSMAQYAIPGPANLHLAFGQVVATAGDINNDGYADLVIGTFDQSSGHAYVYTGSSSGPVYSSTLVGADGTGSRFGTAVASAGDLNGDGYSDVVVGSPYGGGSGGVAGPGAVHVWYGSSTGLVMAGMAPFNILGPDSGSETFGLAVGTIGDVNGDGYPELLVGAPSYSSPAGDMGGVAQIGRVFLFFGGAGGVTTTPGLVIDGPDGAGAQFGQLVFGASW